MKTKRFMSLFLALVMSLALAVPAFADESGDGGEGEPIVQPRLNYLAVDEVITPTGSMWDQAANYKYYRVWVSNSSSTTMRVTLTYPNGRNEEKLLPPGKNDTLFESSSAAAGRYYVNFSNERGDPSGIVRVRVSDKPI